MKKLVNFILKPFKLELQHRDVKWERDAFAKVYESRILNKGKKGEYPAEGIVFSKDRTLQLHVLLSSYFEKVTPAVPVHVLYQTSNVSHANAYRELAEIFSGQNLSFTKQNSNSSFQDDLIKLLESIQSEKVFFLVDDIIFVEDLDLNDFTKFNTDKFVPSLRMGLNLNRCFTIQQEQPLPEWVPGVIKDEDKLCWEWKSGIHDWGYPLSVDGHLFSTFEMATISQLISFNAPNTLEDGLQKFSRLFLPRFGVCYKKTKVVNIPCNKVQSEHANIHGSIDQDFLLEQWQKGLQMNYKKLYGFVNESAHQEIAFELIPRQTRI
ncbi:hypothetical protein ACFL6B_00110 [Thermodesulfobacteriota bacterium]